MSFNHSTIKQQPTFAVRSRAACGKLGSIVVVMLTLISCQTLHAQTKVNVSSLVELREAVQRDNQTIVMKPGQYVLTDLPEGSRKLEISGSKNTINLTDVYVTATVGMTEAEYIIISGNDNVFQGGTFEDVYRNGLKEVTDFSAYNKDRNLARGTRSANLTVRGNNNKIANTKLTVRGSYPYGYGSMYGINAENAFGLNKRSGLQVKGKNNILDGCEVQMRSFGHGIFIQQPSDKTVVKNCHVEGRVRPSKDIYLETDPEDLPVRANYRMKQNRNGDFGPPIPKDIMIPLSEDGIRVYTDGGSVTVEDCTVKKMRGGIRLYLSGGASVSNCTAIDCGLTNFNLPTRGKMTGSIGNFAYAPLIDFPGTKSGQTIQLTIAPSPHIVGPHNIADISGKGHKIVFSRLPGPTDTNLRPIVISASKSTIRNETEYPIQLESSATRNTIFSVGPVTDRGSDNKVKRIKARKSKSGESENQFRTWESKNGDKLLAKLIAQKGNSLTLEKIDGSRVTGRLRDLSKADREYIANQDKVPIRTWTSTNGGFTIDAKFVSKKRDSVTLEKADGSKITVPLDKLSKADQDYVDEQ